MQLRPKGEVSGEGDRERAPSITSCTGDSEEDLPEHLTKAIPHTGEEDFQLHLDSSTLFPVNKHSSLFKYSHIEFGKMSQWL